MKCERCKENEATARRVGAPPHLFLCLGCLTDEEWESLYLVPKSVDVSDVAALRAAAVECREGVERLQLGDFSLLRGIVQVKTF